MRSIRRSARSERGASAVEFALVVIPLLYLVFGIISYGFMLSFRQSISQGAGEAARAAAVAPAGLPLAQVRTRSLGAMNDSLSSYGVSCNLSAAQAGTAGTVTADLMHAGVDSGDCVFSDRQACTSGTATAQCVKITVDYLYRAHSLIPDTGFGFVVPSNLTYSSEVQVS